MFENEIPFAVRISNISDSISEEIANNVDMIKLRDDRSYIYDIQSRWLKNLLLEKAKKENLIVQIYFQFAPETTPQLGEDEFGAGVCIENVGNWEICEHNMSYIKDFVPENGFLKWWYFESIRIKKSGFTRMYFDQYLQKNVITYSVSVYSKNEDSDGQLIGVLGIDIDYNDFKNEMNRKLMDSIKGDIESVKKDFELIGKPGIFDNQVIDVNNLEVVNKNTINSESLLESMDMENALELAQKASSSDANVLLQGETGVGKDYLADFIHSNSEFKNGKFINVNCCALPENLIESEFFGYSEGAFTGARGKGKAGYFEEADGGTILLNEIGDLPMHMQTILLNVIQEKTIVRIGETKSRKVDFRLITATNKDLMKLVASGEFREDLYYRINVISIYIPPLRKRNDDLLSLIHYFFNKNSEKYGYHKSMSEGLLNRLLKYKWPGNIRELENLIERLFVTTNSSQLTESDLPEEFLYRELQSEKPHSIEDFSEEPNKDLTLKEMLENAEKKIFVDSYNKYRSSYKVAKKLSISQSQASQKIRKYIKEVEVDK